MSKRAARADLSSKRAFHSQICCRNTNEVSDIVRSAEHANSRVSAAGTSSLKTEPWGAVTLSNDQQLLRGPIHNLLTIYPIEANKMVDVVTNDKINSMGSLPNPYTSAQTTASTMNFSRHDQRISAFQTRYPMSKWTLRFEDASLEKEYDLRVRHKAILGDVVTAICLLTLVVLLFLAPWYLLTPGQQNILRAMLPGFMFACVSYVPLFVSAAIVPWKKLKNFHIWLFYFAVVCGGSVTVACIQFKWNIRGGS
ncbi:hypothetical protein HDU76_014110 [Blyttiomyces sp. JEL0837]|nr:hypothetical protein HDU76_014110 [Blyttiomyces sp. JEL0837]